eukprot:1124338-Pelagomonas_calceolata.AAC.2
MFLCRIYWSTRLRLMGSMPCKQHPHLYTCDVHKVPQLQVSTLIAYGCQRSCRAGRDGHHSAGAPRPVPGAVQGDAMLQRGLEGEAAGAGSQRNDLGVLTLTKAVPAGGEANLTCTHIYMDTPATESQLNTSIPRAATATPDIHTST